MSTSELSDLLANMRPELVPGRFVFVELPGVGLEGNGLLATVRESEGTSAVVHQSDADRHGLDYDFVAAWITLRVHSALSAVGLTAAVSARLAENGISCNVIAGLRHDHLLVPVDRAGQAVELLRQLSAAGESP